MRKQFMKFGFFSSSNSELNKIKANAAKKKRSDTKVKHHKKERAHHKVENQEESAPWPFTPEGYLIEDCAHDKHKNRHIERELSRKSRRYYGNYHSIDKEFFVISPEEIKTLKKKLKEPPQSEERKKRHTSHSFDATLKKIEKISYSSSSPREKIHHERHRESRSFDVTPKHVEKKKKLTEKTETASLPIKTLYVHEKTFIDDTETEEHKKKKKRKKKSDDNLNRSKAERISSKEVIQIGDTKEHKHKKHSSDKLLDSSEPLIKKKSKKKNDAVKHKEHSDQTSNSDESSKKKKSKKKIVSPAGVKDNSDKTSNPEEFNKRKSKKSIETPAKAHSDKTSNSEESSKKKVKNKAETPLDHLSVKEYNIAKNSNPGELSKKKLRNGDPIDYLTAATNLINSRKSEDSKKSSNSRVGDNNKNIKRRSSRTLKKCVVQTMVSVIDIKPQSHKQKNVENLLEKKKESSLFRKYYDFTFEPKTKKDTFISLSDSNKIYLGCSDQSESSLGTIEKKKMQFEEMKKSRDVNKNNGTTIIAVCADNKKNTKSKFGIYRSKIPVPNTNNSKFVETSKNYKPDSSENDKKERNIGILKSLKKSCSKIANSANITVRSKKIENIEEINENECKVVEENTQKTLDKSNIAKITKRSNTVSKKITTKSNRDKMSEDSKPPVVKKDITKKRSVSAPVKQPKIEKKSDISSLKLPERKQNNKKSGSLSRNIQPKMDENKSPPMTYRKKSEDVVICQKEKTPSSKKNSFISTKTDSTAISKKKIERSSTKASLCNSVSPPCSIGDKSTDSARNQTSFLLTKNYNDEDKLNRWRKRKMYADIVRQNLINKNQNFKMPAQQQMMEVRFLTVELNDEKAAKNVESCKIEEIFDDQDNVKDCLESDTPSCLENDLPNCAELVPLPKFNELFESTLNGALEDIMHENYNFLKKDFSFEPKKITIEDDTSDSASKKSAGNIEKEKISDESVEWHDFVIDDCDDILYNEKLVDKFYQNNSPLSFDTGEEKITDSCSAPGSEESGYSTVKSQRSFFERPVIKDLMKCSPRILTPLSSDHSSICTLDLCQSRYRDGQVQTSTPKYSQKSLQIKMVEHEVLLCSGSDVTKIYEVHNQKSSSCNNDDFKDCVDGVVQDQSKTLISNNNNNLSIVTFYSEFVIDQKKHHQSLFRRFLNIFRRKKYRGSCVVALDCITKNKE